MTEPLINIIPPSLALTSGADLWVVSDSQHSRWNQKIDWYIRFQMRKNNLQKRKTTSKEMKTLLEKHKIQINEWNLKKTSPLLVESSQFLPTYSVLELAYRDDWSQSVYEIWKSMRTPSLRIFLPFSLPFNEFKKLWSPSEKLHTIECVVKDFEKQKDEL